MPQPSWPPRKPTGWSKCSDQGFQHVALMPLLIKTARRGGAEAAATKAMGRVMEERTTESTDDYKPCQDLRQSLSGRNALTAHPEKRRPNVKDDSHSLLERVAVALERIAEHVAPKPDNIVGTDYVASRLGCTPTHVARLVRDGSIPISCVVAGCGDGRPWKFLRARIDDWLEMR